MSNTKTSGFHYGWVIVVSCFMIMCFALCLIMNCFGLFIKPVTEDLGMSRQAFSMNSTMISAAMMVVSFFSGKVFSGRVSIKKIMMVATVGLSASYALYSMASTPVVFYAISIAVGIFLALLAQVPCSCWSITGSGKRRALPWVLSSWEAVSAALSSIPSSAR